ncbi:MAG: GAF domain-containing protein [Candidatus Manganitrophaceae bacterium]
MIKAPFPDNEPDRIQALHQYRILDTLPEDVFDDIALLASKICATPIGLITFVDSERQWFKSKVGLAISETIRDVAFCAHAILEPDFLIVPDALSDSRFSDNPLVTGEPKIRFYAGVPFKTSDGLTLGTLCVIDRVPKDFDAAQRDALRSLARHVMTLLNLRRTLVEFQRAEEALRVSETKKQALLDVLPDLMFQIGRDGTFLDFKASKELEPKFPPSLFLGKKMEEVLGPAVAVEGMGYLERALETREIQFFEYPLEVKGKRRYYEARIVPSGKDQVLAIVREVTFRRQAEEKLQESQKYRSSLLETAKKLQRADSYEDILSAVLPEIEAILGFRSVWIYLLNEDGETVRLLSVQGTASEKISGEVVTLKIAGDLMLEEILSATEPVLVRDARTDPRTNKEIVNAVGCRTLVNIPLFQKGKRIGALGVGTFGEEGVRSLSQGQIDYFTSMASHVAIALNRTRSLEDRLHAEEALAEEKERLAVTLASIGEGVITTDEKGVVILMNRVAEILTGWSRREAVGHPLAQIFHVVDEESGVRIIKMEEGFDLTDPAVIIARDGTRRLITQSGAPIRDDEGRIIGVVLVLRDITQKRKMEEDLIRADKIEAVGLLAGGIAHDFNNILTAILGNLSLAQMSINPKDPLSKWVNEAEVATFRARDLAQQLLTFAKGGAPIKKSRAIAPLLEETIPFVLRGSNVNAVFFLTDDLRPVEIDEGQITQVLHNLAINARQAMPEGGTIYISAENHFVSERENDLLLPLGGYVKISIRDFGVGIPKEHLSKVFDPYFTTKQKGSGLGLSTSFSIVKKHGGIMTVDSESGKGATFSVYLPVSLRVAASEKKQEMVIQGRGRVLVMDDEEAVRKVAGQILAYLGYEVDAVEDGGAAVARYEEAKRSGRPFDLVLMDLTVPGKMGGKEAIRKLLEIDPNAKVVVSSGYSNDPIMAEYSKYGFKGVITKPYRAADVSKILHDLLEGF